ncbi:MAG: MBG domain-containing protein [Gemmataceae bacterium]
MAQKPRNNRWNGWLKRKPSILRPFPSLRVEELELRDVPATFTWSGGGGVANPNWSNPANWVGGIAPTGLPQPLGVYDDLVFSSSGATRLANNDILNGIFNSMSFSSAGSNGYTLTGNSLTLGVAGFPGTGFLNVSQNSLGHDIQLDMKLNTGLAGFPASVQTFDVDGGLRISGRLSGNSSTSLNSSGIGTLTLAGDNSALLGAITITTNGPSGRLVVANPNALGDTINGTTVGTGTSLVFADVGGPVGESISLNGSGNGDGTLYNQSGDNLLTGPIILDDADNTNGIIIKSETATSLTINGIISDRSVGRILTKEGRGEVVLNAANTYRGLTQVNSGVLTVGNALALGAGGDANSGTVVRSATAGQGQLRLASPNGTGFTILDEFLTLNGAGQAGLLNRGSLTNTNADNTWAGPVTLGSPIPNGVPVTIGTGAGTLTISGVISTPNGIGNNAGANPPNSNGAGSLTKVDLGKLIFNNANTYSCPTFVNEGILVVRDSQSLGQASAILGAPIPTVSVASGATLQLEVEAGAGPNGTALPNLDAHGRDLSVDSITGDAHRLQISNPLNLSGLGVLAADGFRAGALFSHSGINVWTAGITSNAAGIGVALDPRTGHPTPDSSYFTEDYSLTTTAAIGGSSVTKLQLGHLIWPTANTYTAQTYVQRGWITAMNNRAFGARLNAVSPTLQPETYVTSGAAIHLRTLTPSSPPLYIDENFILAGTGPKLPYKFISEKGALMNISGDNVIGVDDPTLPAWTTYVALNGNVGIGVEQIAPATVSRLTVLGWMRDDTVTPAGVQVPNLGGPATRGPGGITKYGSQRLLLEGDGTYSLANNIKEGIVEARHNTALGQSTSGTYNATSGSTPEVYNQTTTTVQSAANLLLDRSNAFTNGGIASGVQVAHEQLVLNASGQQIAVAGSKVPAPSEFYLTFTNHLTDLLPASTRTTPGLESGLTAADMEAELNKLPSVKGSEIQEITTGAAGTFTLTFNGQTTAVPAGGIPAGSSAAVVQAALLTLTSIRRNEIQDVIVLNGTAANAFTLTFNGQTTASIPGNATNLQVQTALNALSNIGAGGVTVVRVAVPGGFRYTVTFSGAAVQYTNFPLMTAAGQSGLATPLVQPVQDGFNGTVTVTAAPGVPTGTVYTLTFGGDLAFQNLPQTTVAGTAAGPVRTMRDGINGSIAVSEGIGAGNGNLYTLTFGGDLANVDLPQMTVTAKDGTLPTINTLQNGSAPATGEIQTVSVVASQGTYTLSFGADTTNPIPITAPAVLVENEINTHLPSLVALLRGQVLVSKSGNVYTAVFNTAHSADTPRLVATPIFSPLGTPEVTISGNVDVDGYVSQASLVSAREDANWLGADNTWRGPVVMNSGARVATTQNTRINFLGEVSDASNSNVAGSDLVKRGKGELLLAGLNTFRGQTWIDEGIATVANSGALGTTQGGTTVANNAQLQVQGSLTVAGESLTIQGTGVQDASTLVDKWFNVGPASSNGVPTSGTQTVSARITSVTTDPQDPNVIYIATAGGGAWKTRDRGVNWVPLFDDTVDAAAVMYGGQIVVAPSNPNIVYFATGEANGGPNGSPVGGARDSFAGTGVYVSTNAGVTWRLVTGPNSNNPIYGLAVSKMIVDPVNPQRIYVATGASSVINGGVNQIANNLFGTAIPGVYRYDGSVASPNWVNLTGLPSANRATVAGNSPFTTPPLNAGPDDDYRIMFPQNNATWSDIALVASGRAGNGDAGNTVNGFAWTLYAALGESQQRYFTSATSQGIFNAVYRTEDPASTFAAGQGPTWWIGNGTIFPVSDPTNSETTLADNSPPAPTVPDQRPTSTYYHIGPESDPVPVPAAFHQPGRNEWIKLSVVVTKYFNEQPSGTSTLPTGNRVNPAIQVYATNLGNSVDFFPFANPNINHTGEFLDIQRSGWDGGIGTSWTQDINKEGNGFSSPPFGLASTGGFAVGRYSNVLTNPSRTFGLVDTTPNVNTRLYFGAKDDVWLVDGIRGAANLTWTPFTRTTNSPADYFHALFVDGSTGNLLIGSDGGLWYDNTTFATHSFQNMNGNIAAAQINNIDPHPTDLNQALAALYNSGLQSFSGGLAWNAMTVPSPGADDRVRNAGDVRYDPKNPLNAYASVGGGLYRTQDGGASWQRVLTGSSENSFPVYVDPVNPNRVLIGGSGILETNNANAPLASLPGTFTNLNGGTTVALAAATYQGAFQADPGFPLVTDKLSNTYDPDTIYVTDGTTVRVTKNHGTTWIPRSPFANIFPYRIEFAGSFAGIDQPTAQTNTAGLNPGGQANVTTILNGGAAGNELQSLIVTATSGSYTIRIRTPLGNRTTGPIPYNASTTAIENALNALPGMVNGSPAGAGRVIVTPGTTSNIITDIAVDPSNRDTVYATVRQRNGQLGVPTVFRTTDAGQTWQDISGNSTSAIPVSYTSTDTPILVPDDSPAFGTYGTPATSTINVVAAPGEVVTNISVTLNIQMDFDSDLRIRLQAPDGSIVRLVENRGGGGNDFTNTVLTDSAVTPISAGTAPFTGLFQPEDPLATFNGLDPNGAWKLIIDDNFPVDQATLLNWTLDVTSAPQSSGSLPFTQAWTVAVDPRSDTVYIGNDKGVWKLPNASSTTSYNWSRFGDSLPDVQVHDLVLNQTLNTLTASTYGRGMYQLFLTDYQPAPGGIRVISGNSVWTGDINITGNLTITADGTQEIQNGIAAASLDILGVIRDVTPGNSSTITKSGLGTISFSGSNTYGGQTLVQQGVLRVKNPNALGVPDADSNTIVAEGAALELASDLRGEPVLAYGGGISVNGHFTGAVRSVANNNVYTGPLTLGSNSTIGVNPGNDLDPVINPGVRTDSSLRIGAHPQQGFAAPIVVATTTAGGPGVNDVQTVTIPNTTNFFNLTFNGQTTGLLPRTATAAQIQAALEALPAFVTSVDEVQDIIVTGSAGTFSLTVTTPAGTQTVPSIPYNVTPSVLQALITGLSNVGNGNAVVTLTAPGTYRVRFTNGMGGYNLPLMIAAGSGGATANVAPVTDGAGDIAVSTGVSGSSTVVTLAFRGAYANADQPLFLAGDSAIVATATTVNGSASATEVQTITVFGSTGLFNLNFNGATTGVLAWNATAAQVQAALNGLSTIGGAGGSVLVTSASFGAGGTQYTVTFGGSLANLDVPQILAGDVGTITDSGSVFTLDKELAGTLILSSANVIGGAISVNQGALRVEDPGALGSSGPFSGTQVLDGAQMQIARNAITLVPTVMTSESLLLSGTGIDVTGALRNVRSDSSTTGVNDNTWAGPITFTLNPGFLPQTNPGTRVAVRVDDSLIPGLIDTLNLDTNIQQDSTLGSFGLIKVGPGRLNLMQANSFTGTTEVGVNLGGRDFQGGSLRIANPNSLGPNAISNSVQTLSVVGLTGTYRLSFNGRTTGNLNATATAAQVEAALNALTSIGQAEQQTVTVTGAGTYRLTFDGQTTGAINTAGGTAAVVTALNSLSSVRRSEIQDVLVSNSPGYFTLTFNGERTAPLAHNSTAAQVQTALRALTGIGATGVNVTLSPTVVPGATVYRVSFAGTLANADQPQIVADTYVEDTVQDGGAGQSEIQTFNLFSTTGTFILSFNGLTTTPLPFTATALDIQNALNALPSIGGVNGIVGVSEAAFGSGRQFTLTFGGSLADRDLPLIQAAGVGGPVTSVVKVQDGLNGSVTVTGTAANYTVTFGGDLAARDVSTITSGSFTGGVTSVAVATGRPGGGVVVSETPSVGGKVLTVSFQRPLDLAIIPQIQSTNVSSGLAVNVATAQQGGIGAIVNNTGGPGSLEIDGDPLNGGASINVIRDVVINGTGVSGGVRVTQSPVSGGTAYAITFDGALGHADLPLFAAAGAGGATAAVTLNQDGNRTRNEVQTVTVTGTAGTFTLSLNGVTTAPIPFNATATQVQNALNALTGIGGSAGALVNVSGKNTYSGNVSIASASHLGANPSTSLDVPVFRDNRALTIDPTRTLPTAAPLAKVGLGTIVFPNANAYGGLTTVRDGVLAAGNPQAVGTGRNETQIITTNGTTGAFTLTFNGQTTVPLLFDTAASGGTNPIDSVENALNAISSVRRSEIQTVTLAGSVGGTFTITFGGQATSALAFNASASTIQAALEALSSIGVGNVLVSRAGNVITVTFAGALANTDVAPLAATGLGGTTATAAVVQDGLGGTVTVTTQLVPGGRQYTVVFGGDLANMNLPEMTVASAMVFTSTEVNGTASVSETQRVETYVTGAQTFTLTFNGQTTVALAAGVQAVSTPANEYPAGPANDSVRNALLALSSVRRNEVQTLLVQGTSGTFSLGNIITPFGGPTTLTGLAYNIPASGPGSLQVALEGLANIGVGNVTVTSVAGAGFTTYTITFTGALANRNLPQMTAAGAGGAVPSVTTAFDGLNGDVTVTLDPPAVPATARRVYRVTFGGDLANRDVVQMTGASATASSFISPRTDFDGNGSETQYVNVTATNGTFFLSFRGQTTSALLFTASAADVERALNALTTIGGIGGFVTVTKSGSNAAPGGATFTVHFGGTLAATNVPFIGVAQTTGGTVVLVSAGNDGPEGTTVVNGATLQLRGNMVMDREAVTLNGQGFQNQGALNVNGGNVTWQALNPNVRVPLFLGSNASVGTTLPTDTLTFLLPVTDQPQSPPAAPPSLSTGRNLDIYGPGTVVYAATQSGLLEGTTYTQYTGTTTVHDGTLLLSQPGGNSILGPLVVGDGVGAPNSAVVRETISNQIADSVAIRVNSDGLFDLNGFTDVVSDVTVVGGRIDTGPAGQLTTGFIDMTGGTINIGNNAKVTAQGNITMRSGASVVGATSATLVGQQNLSMNASSMSFGNLGTVTVNDVTMSNGSTIDFANNGTFTAKNVTADGGRIAFLNSGTFSLANLAYSNGLVSFGNDGTFAATGNVALDKTTLSFGSKGAATVSGKLDAVDSSLVSFGTIGTLTTGNATFTDSDLTMGDTALATVANLTVTNADLSFGTGVTGGTSTLIAQDVRSTNSNFRFGDNGSFAAANIVSAIGGEIDFKDTGLLSVAGNASFNDTDVRFDNGGQFSATDVTGILGTLIEFLLNGILNLDDFVLASGSEITMGSKALATMSTADLTDSTATFTDNVTVTVLGNLRMAGSDLTVGLPAVSGESSLLQTGNVSLLATTDGSHITLGSEDTGIFGNITSTGGNTTANHNSVVAGDNTQVSAFNITATDTDFRFGNDATFNTNVVSLTGTGGAGNAAPEIRLGTDGTFTTSGSLTLNNAEVTLGDRNLVAPQFDTQAIAMSNNAKITLGAGTLGSSLGIAINGSTFIIGANAKHTLGGDITSSSNIAVTSAILGPGTLDLGGSGRTVTVNDGPRPVDLTVTAAIASGPTERLVKEGDGRLQFAPAGGFTAPVTINRGDVQVDTAISTVNLKNALGSLSGTGTVGQVDGAPPANARAVGTVNPGVNYLANPAGILNTGNLLWGPNTTYFVNVANGTNSHPLAVAGTDNDLLNVTGSVVLGGAQLNGTFDRANVQVGDRFTIIQSTGPISGRFAEPYGANVAYIDGHKFTVQYNTNSVVLTKVLANITSMGVTASLNPATQRQQVTLTATMTPEAGAGNISSANTVTFTFTNLDSPFQTYTGTVNVTAGTNAATFLTNGNVTGQPFLPGGRYQVTATYNGDPVDFVTANASLTGNPLVIEIPVFDTPVASVPFISPQNSPGVQDTTVLSATVIRERGRLQAWSFDIYNSSNTLVRTLAYSGPLFDPTPSDTTVPISALWNGRDTGGAFVPSGDYSVIANFTDEFGNTGASAPITVVVDDLSPTVTTPSAPQLISPNLTGLATPTSATITSTVGDQPFTGHPAGTFQSWTIEIRNSANAIVRTFTGTNTSVSQPWNGTLANNTTPVPDGVYTITIRSQDQAGNTTTSSGTPIVVLNSPPTSVGSSVPTSTVYGQTIALHATVTVLANDANVPAGVRGLLLGDTVEFYRDATTLLGSAPITFDGTNYVADITVPTFNAGTYSSMFVRYAGSSDFIAGNSPSFTHIVTPAPLTVTAVDVFKQYGDPVPTLNLVNGYLNVSGLVNGDLAPNVVSGAAATTATQSSPVIPAGYPITQGGVTANPNYNMTFVPGTLYVTKAPLTLTIDNKQRSFHAANPTFTVSATGLLLGDTVSVVTGFTLQTTATVNSRPGTYPIFSVGTPTAQNYTITNLVSGNIKPDGTLEVIPIPTPLVVGPGAGMGPLVKVYSPTGVAQNQFFAFNPAFTGGVRTATGDFNRDGVMDLVVGTGPGTQDLVRVIDGATGVTLFSVLPFEDFTGGVFVAAGDIDGDGADELVITPDEGGGPRIAAYRGMTFAPFISYFGINDPNFRGGARAAVGDINGDGYADIALSAGFGGGPRVSIWDGKSLASLQFKNLVPDFFAYEDTLRNGTYVAIGDVDGDGKAELITGAGPGGGPRVKIFSATDLLAGNGANTRLLADFFAGNPENRGGVRVAVKSLDNDLLADLATGVGEKGGNTVTTYLGSDLKNAVQDPLFDPFFDIEAYPGFLNGVFVG